MATRMTQAERRQRTRSALLDAASALFAERGFAGVSVENIAERAGYTTGAVYDHFENKEGTLLAVFEREVANDGLAEHLRQAVPNDATSVEEVLRVFGRIAATRLHNTTGNDLTFEVYACAVRNPALRERVGAVLAAGLREFGDAIPIRGDLTGIDVAVLGQAILDGLRLRSILSPDLVRDELYEIGLALLACLPGIGQADDESSPRAHQ